MPFPLSSKLYCLYPTCVSAKCAIRTMLLLRLPAFQETFQLASKPLTLILRSLSTILLYRQLPHNNLTIALAQGIGMNLRRTLRNHNKEDTEFSSFSRDFINDRT